MTAAHAHLREPKRQRWTLRITVLAGGPSREREVSLESGAAVAEALRRRGHKVTVLDIDPDHLEALDQPADVVFPALHGTFGEDGTVQRLLADRGIAFVGSDAASSALAMDKVATKRRVEQLRILTPEYRTFSHERPRPGEALDPPCVVKPVDEGSSVDTTLARTADVRDEAIRRICTRYGRVLVERFVPGMEVTVGIFGDQSLPPICIRPKQGFYDYAAKYEADDTEYIFDPLPPKVLKRLGRDSERIFHDLGCRHLARVDWIVDDQHRHWFLEVNTIPGFTSHSLLPKAAACVGVDFDELCDRLVRMAVEDEE
jgi:D-alanine-D-alanine ligase